MDWLLDIVREVVSAFFDSVRRATFRDGRRPSWLRYSLVVSYCALPTLMLVLVLVSWKLGAVTCGLFVIALIAGAATEEDDPKFG